MLFSGILFLLLLSTVTAHPVAGGHPVSSSYYDDINNATYDNFSSKDKRFVKHYLEKLSKVTNSNSTSTCQRCVNELNIGKEAALKRLDLIPTIFTKWCKDNDIDKKKNCEMAYGRLTVNSSTTGADFGNMLSLMDPNSIDGEYYCYYKRKKACDLPETIDIDISSWWPEKLNNTVTPENSGETFNVLHISDHHLELHYTVGAEANCTDNGMCCTPHNDNDQKLPINWNTNSSTYNSLYSGSYYNNEGQYVLGSKLLNPFKSGGENQDQSVWQPSTIFGAYTCDSPEILVNSSLKSVADFQAKQNLSFDFALFTGDLVDHDELQYTNYADSIEEEELVFRDMKKWLKDIPVYSVMGNHDTFPYGQIAQESSGFNNKFTWNADLMAHLWSDNNWIDAGTAQEVLEHYCGFSVTTKHKNLKVITLNSNTYYQKNYYSYWNMTEPDTFGTLRWLVDELVESERKNQRVWIMAHIPFIDYDALPIPAKLYVKIIKRFSPSTIAGIFFGHTHQDQFSVLYASDGKELGDEVNFAWISQSVTPISKHNPGWRWYEVDKNSFNIMNSHNYFTKLNETFGNNGAEPKWEHLYDAREAYDPQHKWPSDAPLNATFWSKVAKEIGTSNATAQQYGIYSYRDSPYNPVCEEGDCYDYYCYTTSFTYESYYNCVDGNTRY